jgi:catechol 2,3-dioxygenase-like lactoylglutathione lyase family enzyme
MITGISHIALTVSALDESLPFYRKHFGFEVLNDAERKGERIEKIIGIPGFHTRTVYVSVSPIAHIELFEFFHPKALPAAENRGPELGFSYGALETESLLKIIETTKADPSCEARESNDRGRRCVSVRDPNGMKLRFVEKAEKGSPGTSLLYPAFIVNDLEASGRFYRDVFELEVVEGSKHDGEMVFEARDGVCLKLIQAPKDRLLPSRPWRMEQVGFTHFALATENLSEFYEKLVERHVAFNSPPQTLTAGPHEGGQGVFLKTPEGFAIELLDSPLTNRK